MLRTLVPTLSYLKFSKGPTIRPDLQSQPNFLKSVQKTNYGSLRTITQQRRKQSKIFVKKYKQNLPTPQVSQITQNHVCQVTLYMKHNQWQSQYVYSLMNYQQLGFTRISDYVFLKQIEKYLYNTHKKINYNKEYNQKWPILKVKVGLQQSKYIRGIKQICNFIQDNQLFKYQVQDDIHLSSIVQKYVDQNIVPHLQTIFWHPKLTYQQIFHTNLSSFGRVNMNYKLIPIFYTNIYRVSTNIVKNTFKILLNQQKYLKSRQNLMNGLKQFVTLLNNKQFIGGDKPNHLDFYLFAKLNTKITSKNFQKFLRNQIGKNFWDWFYRMNRAAQYSVERITIL